MIFSADGVQAWADAFQAAVVGFSIVFAGFRYLITLRKRARSVIIEMVNLADEFPYIASEDMRYAILCKREAYEAALKYKVKDVPQKPSDPPYDEMMTTLRIFSDRFHASLSNLWEALDNNVLGKYSRSKTSNLSTKNVLNVAASIEHGISRFQAALSTGNDVSVQEEKELLAKSLYRFTQSLATLAVEKGIVNVKSDIDEYDPVLSEYVGYAKELDTLIIAQFKDGETSYKWADRSEAIGKQIPREKISQIRIDQQVSYDDNLADATSGEIEERIFGKPDARINSWTNHHKHLAEAIQRDRLRRVALKGGTGKYTLTRNYLTKAGAISRRMPSYVITKK